MAMNFMEAGTEIESLVEKVESEKSKISNIIANAIVTRAKQGKINTSLGKDIDNLLRGLSTEEKYKIMLKVAYYLANSGEYGNTSTSSTPKKKKKSYDDNDYDFFGKRGF